MTVKLVRENLTGFANRWHFAPLYWFLVLAFLFAPWMVHSQTTVEAPVVTGVITLNYEVPDCAPPSVLRDGECENGAETGSGTGSGPGTGSGVDATARPETALLPALPVVTITLASDALRAGRQRIDYGREVLKASGGATPYQYSLADGQLPDGLQLSAQGALGGTPTTIGSFRFTVKASDANGAIGQRDYLIDVTAPGSVTAPSASDEVVVEACTPGKQRVDGTCGEDTTVTNGGGPECAADDQNCSATGNPTSTPIATNTPVSPQITEPGSTGGWSLITDKSKVKMTTRGPRAATYIFKGLAGTIDPEGNSELVVSLASLEANDAQLNMFFKLLLFETQLFPDAVTVARVDTAALEALAVGASAQINLPFSLTLHNQTASLTANLTATRTDSTTVELVSNTPTDVSAADFGLMAGVERLGVALGFPDLTATVGIGFVLAYEIPEDESTPGAAIANTGCADGAANCPNQGGASTSTPVEAPAVFIALRPEALRDGRQRVDYGREVFTALGGVKPYLFALSQGQLPPGLTLTPEGALTGIPTDAGSFRFTVAATDVDRNSGQQSYVVAIVVPGGVTAPKAEDEVVIGQEPDQIIPPAAQPLVFAPDALPLATVGVPYGPVEVILSGGATPYTIFAQTDLQDGLTMSYLGRGNGVQISGVPLLSGSRDQALILNAIDAKGVGISKVYALSVDKPLTISPETLPDGTIGETYGPVDVILSGGATPYTIVSAEALPAGLRMTSLQSGAGVRVSGNPTVPGTIDRAVVLSGLDARGVAISKAFRLEIADAACPDITMYRFAGQCVCPEGTEYLGGICAEPVELTPESFADGTRNVPYLPVQLVASGSGPYSFRALADDGGLPENVQLSASGRLSGTPASTGEHTFTVEVQRAGKVVKTQNYSLFVAEVVIDVGPAELPAGNVAAQYSQQLTASGGKEPYQFQFVGSGPAWLSLTTSGALSGVPNTPGTAAFAVRVRDANENDSEDRSYAFAVEPAVCPLPGMMASINPDTPSACQCKPTLFPFAVGQGCGPCEDGQKPFGETCPAPVAPVTAAPVTTVDTCTGGMALQSNGVCGCPSDKPRIVNGVCTAAPKAPTPTPPKQPTATTPNPSSSNGCKPGDVQFASEAELLAYLDSQGGGYKVITGARSIYCGPPQTSRPSNPQVNNPPRTNPQQQTGNQCNIAAGILVCTVLNLTFDANRCECGGSLPSTDSSDDNNQGDYQGGSNGDFNSQPLSCDQNCANVWGLGSEEYQSCIYNQCEQ